MRGLVSTAAMSNEKSPEHDGITSRAARTSAENSSSDIEAAVGRNDDNPNDTAMLNSAPAESQPTPPPYTIFSPRMKIFLVLMTVFSTLFSPFSSFIYLPAITPIAESYNLSVADINLTVTLYQVMQAIAPLFFGDLSDRIGRRPVYIATFIIYIGANIGLAMQNNYAALLVLRALQSTGSSATVAIGSAVMADFTTAADRGGYITAVQASIMFAPALAPIIGGILTQFLGWRSTFWFLVIGAGVFLVIYVPFVPEVSSIPAQDKLAIPDQTQLPDSAQHRWKRLHRPSQSQLLPILTPPPNPLPVSIPPNHSHNRHHSHQTPP